MSDIFAITDVTLRTKRLLLRRFRPSDADDVARMCGDFEVARWLSRVPHPYPVEEARSWIAGQENAFRTEKAFAISHESKLVGCVGLTGSDKAWEIGYWIGRPFWGKGFATEAASALCDYAFLDLDADRLVSGHFTGNAASANVLTKCGFRYDGTSTEEHSVSLGHTVVNQRMERTREAWSDQAGRQTQ